MRQSDHLLDFKDNNRKIHFSKHIYSSIHPSFLPHFFSIYSPFYYVKEEEKVFYGSSPSATRCMANEASSISIANGNRSNDLIRYGPGQLTFIPITMEAVYYILRSSFVESILLRIRQ
jgi:hypothetical protein